MVVIVRLRQLILAEKECIETFAPAQFEFLVHLNCFEQANLDADLAAHADRNIDVEHRGIKLRFAHVIGLLVFAFNDIDALRRAFLLTYFARHTAQTGFGIVGVVN